MGLIIDMLLLWFARISAATCPMLQVTMLVTISD